MYVLKCQEQEEIVEEKSLYSYYEYYPEEFSSQLFFSLQNVQITFCRDPH